MTPSQPYGRGGGDACPGRKPKGHRGRLWAAYELPDHQQCWWSLHLKGVAAIDQPYSFWADLLNKFHTAPELIQALWLIVMPATLLGLTWLVMRGLTQLVPMLSRRSWHGQLIYGVYQDGRGRWMIYRHDRQPQEIDWTNPPPSWPGLTRPSTRSTCGGSRGVDPRHKAGDDGEGPGMTGEGYRGVMISTCRSMATSSGVIRQT
ncbi:hypothetical protein [Microvirga vignae]|uniref:hypothetical protein n=1 Tax=Microvirga vignae TaxID=1225564 RepID=UPI001FCD66FA|nr:hypothetical protein [Microvirga vignae]